MWVEIAANTWAEAKDEEEAQKIKDKFKDYKKKGGDLISRHIVINLMDESNFIKWS